MTAKRECSSFVFSVVLTFVKIKCPLLNDKHVLEATGMLSILTTVLQVQSLAGVKVIQCKEEDHGVGVSCTLWQAVL